MKKLRKDIVIPPEECKMMDLMVKTGFSKLHPGGKYSTVQLLEFCDIGPDKKVIDIGCGPGETAIDIARRFGCHVTGIDIMPEMIKQARENASKQKVSHLTKFETIDAMTPCCYHDSFDIAIFQAVLIFGDKQKMLNFAYKALKDDGQVGAVELTWSKDPSGEIVETFSSKLAKPLVNVETREDWISSLNNAGFQGAVCKDIQSMNMKSFVRMWRGEQWINKIKIVMKCFTSPGVIHSMFTILNLFKKYPDTLDYGFYLGRK